MAGNQQIIALWASVNDYTNQLADGQAEANLAMTEIATDVDELLAKLAAGETFTPEEIAGFQATADKAKTVAEAQAAHVATLRAIAAKNDNPLPPPVEPPPA